MAEYIKLQDYVVYAEEANGAVEVTVQPHDLTKLSQYRFVVPAEGEATSTKLTADTDVAQAKAAEMEAAGAVDAKFADQMRAEAIKAKKAQLQAEADELNSKLVELNLKISELDTGKLGAEIIDVEPIDVKPIEGVKG